MKFKRFGIWAMCILILVSFTLTVVSAANLKGITIISAAPGGTQYPLSVGLMSIISNHMPGLTATVDASTGGAYQNLNMINMGKAEIGISNPGAALQAFKGVGEFEGNKCANLRSVIYLSSYINLLQLVTFADSPIKELRDIDGLRVCAGLAGGGHDTFLRSFIDVLGIKPIIINVDFNDGADMLADHRVDYLFIHGAAPNTTIMNLEVLQKIKLVPVSKESAEIILRALPELCLEYTNVLAGTYKRLDQDVPSLGVGGTIVTNKDVPADVIYDFVKAIFENQDIMKAAHPSGAPLYKQDAAKLSVPLHVGALKYYKDNGIDIPEGLILSE